MSFASLLPAVPTILLSSVLLGLVVLAFRTDRTPGDLPILGRALWTSGFVALHAGIVLLVALMVLRLAGYVPGAAASLAASVLALAGALGQAAAMVHGDLVLDEPASPSPEAP